MGACNSSQITSPQNTFPVANHSSAKLFSQQILVCELKETTTVTSQQILQDFTVGKQLQEMLNGVSFTKSQAADLAKSLINGIGILESPGSTSGQHAFKALLNQQNRAMIKNGKLFYHGMLDRLKNHKIEQNLKSRVFHTIANLKKQIKIEEKVKNQYGVECININGYKELSELELQQIIRYECIADKAKGIGENIGFKFQSIKKQSQKMVSLLSQCIAKHLQDLSELNYDLSQKEVMKVASISRQACNFYDNGVFVLLVYFVQSCKRLQGKSKNPQNIEIILKKAIYDISKEYPPGFGLSNEHQKLIKTLKELQDSKTYKNVVFSHQEITLTSQNTKKQEQVEKIITKYALIAEQSQESFQQLVKATCLAKCVYFKIGLKYYPKNPNVKALTRIKQKMFFNKEATHQIQINGGNIKQVLDKEQSQYRNKIDMILEKTEKVQFKITDMVRGKCIFLDIADIIYSVNQIKKFVAQNPQYGIAQIESRFTNSIPISDVTVKIVVSNKIVAQLQLTIQTNAAAYSFAHKIYQLQRTKVFSKIKIVHNYYQQSKDQFGELVKSSFQLQSTKSIISSQNSQKISSFFQLDACSKSFRQILQEAMKVTKYSFNKLQISVDPLLQDLISTAFNISIGKWGKDIGKIINKALKNETLSSKLKSVILSVFFDKLRLPSQSQNMQQVGYLLEQLQQKIYMQEFIRQCFQIQKVFKYINQNPRLYFRALQLQQIVFYKKSQFGPIYLKQTPFVENLVFEQKSFEKVVQIHELFDFYFVTRKQDNYIYDLFSNYSKWVSSQIKSIQTEEDISQIYQIQIVKAQYQIENNNSKQAQKYLQNSLKYFKDQQDHQKVMQCQILLTECRIKNNPLSIKQDIEDYEKNVIKKANILGLQLKGVLYADSLWRIEQYLWEKLKKPQQKQKILTYFTTKALEQMSRSKGKQFVYAIIQRWPQFDKNKIQRPLIKANDHIKYVKMDQIEAAQCEQLSKANWKNITAFILQNNQIEAAGCLHLIKSNWKNLTTLNLDGNNIGATGCHHLSKSGWKNITVLNLRHNNIRSEGCEQLMRAGFKNMTKLNLQSNNIEAAGCSFLKRADWKDLTHLNLKSNRIGPAGCEPLSKADWKNMTSLDLNGSSIGAGGIEVLINADWKNITKLDLGENNIGDAGCEFLIKANWKNITILNLRRNNIQVAGCKSLIKGGWKNLQSLDLFKNNIKAADCEELIKADWPNITTLDLTFNNIGTKGCQCLSKKNWSNLTILCLYGNNIGDAGCHHISQAEWGKIKKIYMGQNSIKEEQLIKKVFVQKGIEIKL